MIAFGSFDQCRQQSCVNAHRNHLAGPFSSRLPAALTKPLDVVPAFGLVRPLADVPLGDGLALDLLHPNIVIRNGSPGKAPAGVEVQAPA